MLENEKEIITAKKELAKLYLLVKMQKKDKVKNMFLFTLYYYLYCNSTKKYQKIKRK